MNKQTQHQKPSVTERRRFIVEGAAVLAGAAIAPGLILHTTARAARAPDEPVSSKVRWGILIDTSRCAEDCDKCVQACKDEHGLTGHDRPETDPQWIRKVKLRDKQTGKISSLPVMCQHCEHPACVDVCPTGASFKRADGIALVDRHICIGCRYCMMACPYKARSLVHESLENQKPYTPRGKGTVEACNLCVHRVDEGRQPACVEACNNAGHKAMLFGDINDPESDISKRLAKESSIQLRADMKLNPGIRYQGI